MRSTAQRDLLEVRVGSLGRVKGVWRAVLKFRGEEFHVDRSVGSWRITPSEDEVGFHELTPSLAAELQRRVRKIERAERRAD